MPPAPPLSVLDYLRRQLAGTLAATDTTFMRYPTAISQLLDFELIAIDPGTATLALNANAARHGNQQGTVHGGLLCELADAAIGTAHSTRMSEGETFTSIDLNATFLRPVWCERLVARAWAEHQGRTISHYRCEILREDGKAVATVSSAVMTLRGEQGRGR